MESPKATTAAILERDGRVLLTRRAIPPFQGRWCIPGGHIERGEKVEDAIRREVKEETNLDFQTQFFGFYEEIFPEIQWHAVVLVFYGLPQGEVKPDHEVSEWKWVSPQEFGKFSPLAFGHDRALEDWLKLRKTKASDGQHLKGHTQPAGGIRA